MNKKQSKFCGVNEIRISLHCLVFKKSITCAGWYFTFYHKQPRQGRIGQLWLGIFLSLLFFINLFFLKKRRVKKKCTGCPVWVRASRTVTQILNDKRWLDLNSHKSNLLCGAGRIVVVHLLFLLDMSSLEVSHSFFSLSTNLLPVLAATASRRPLRCWVRQEHSSKTTWSMQWR